MVGWGVGELIVSFIFVIILLVYFEQLLDFFGLVGLMGFWLFFFVKQLFY